MEANLRADHDRLCLTPHEGKYLYGDEISNNSAFVGNGCIQTAFAKDEDNRYAIILPTQFAQMTGNDRSSMSENQTITFLPYK